MTESLFQFRLVRVRHERCDEYDGTEYVLAPPDWDDEKIHAEIDAASDEMLDEARLIAQSPGKVPFHPEYEKYPDMKVAEVQAEHAARKKVYDEWYAQNRHLTRSLQTRLKERGFVQLWDDENDERTGVVHHDIYWGHNHGVTLNYERPKPL